MKTPGIVLRRYPYEEPYHLNLVLSAFAAEWSGQLEFYCNAEDLAEVGKSLLTFPTKIPDEFVYELGSPDPAVRFAFHLKLRFFTIGSVGHCALCISMNNNGRDYEAASCSFGMRTEPEAIRSLGQALIAFRALEHRQLRWIASGESDLSIEINNDAGEPPGGD